MPTRQANRQSAEKKIRQSTPPAPDHNPLDIPVFLKGDPEKLAKAGPAPHLKKPASALEEWEIEAETLKIEGLRWVRTYFYGTGLKDRAINVGVVNDPPCCGWTGIYLIPGEKHSTLLCPYSIKSYSVANDCTEVTSAVDAPFEGEYHRALLKRQYEKLAKEGAQAAFDVAALVMTRLGMAVPAIHRPEPEAPTGERTERKPKSGGKPIIEEALRPIKPVGKRADVARYFLKGGPVPIRAAMAELDLTRSGVLSHLFCINRDHGLGYELGNDCAALTVPKGHEVFGVAEAKAPKVDAKPRANKKEKGSHEYVEGVYTITKMGSGLWYIFKDGVDTGQSNEDLKSARAWCRLQKKAKTSGVRLAKAKLKKKGGRK